MTRDRPVVDRPAAIRAALRALVAERGFHGASMQAVAKRAGVAAGTAYVHYASKDDVVLAAYIEAKRTIGRAAVAAIDAPVTPRDRFVQMWIGAYEYLRSTPDDARFLLQVEDSPYGQMAHEQVVAGGDDPLMVELTRSYLWSSFVELPVMVLSELGLAPAVRLAAQGLSLEPVQVRAVAHGCWAAVTTAPPSDPVGER